MSLVTDEKGHLCIDCSESQLSLIETEDTFELLTNHTFLYTMFKQALVYVFAAPLFVSGELKFY